MILEESILFYEEQAKKCNNKVNQIILGAERCEQDKQEYTQLAEWLRELQERRKQPEQRWIPVSERLPEEHESMFARFYGSERWNRSMWLRQSDRVLVTSELADGTRVTETARTRDGEWKPDHVILKREIVAWMPMPKPYKGETDETY